MCPAEDFQRGGGRGQHAHGMCCCQLERFLWAEPHVGDRFGPDQVRLLRTLDGEPKELGVVSMRQYLGGHPSSERHQTLWVVHQHAGFFV